MPQTPFTASAVLLTLIITYATALRERFVSGGIQPMRYGFCTGFATPLKDRIDYTLLDAVRQRIAQAMPMVG